MQRFMVASYFICFIPFKRGEDGCGSDEPKGLCQCVLFNGAYIVFTCHFTPCVFPTLASLTNQERSSWSIFFRSESWGSDSDASVDPNEDSQAGATFHISECGFSSRLQAANGSCQVALPRCKKRAFAAAEAFFSDAQKCKNLPGGAVFRVSSLLACL